ELVREVFHAVGKELLLHARLELEQILGRSTAEVFGFHHSSPRARKRVAIGNLEPAMRNASLASSALTPDSSNRTRPAFTIATHCSTEPLPEPMRTSRGFFVTGLSGNTRIQRFPCRLTFLVMAIRPASICRDVRRPFSVANMPKSPKSTDVPRHDMPRFLPFCCFRNLVRLGDNMAGESYFKVRRALRGKTQPVEVQ